MGEEIFRFEGGGNGYLRAVEGEYWIRSLSWVGYGSVVRVFVVIGKSMNSFFIYLIFRFWCGFLGFWSRGVFFEDRFVLVVIN